MSSGASRLTGVLHPSVLLSRRRLLATRFQPHCIVCHIGQAWRFTGGWGCVTLVQVCTFLHAPLVLALCLSCRKGASAAVESAMQRSCCRMHTSEASVSPFSAPEHRPIRQRARRTCANAGMPPFHLAFPVHDLREARSFYLNTLGCTEGRSSARCAFRWQVLQRLLACLIQVCMFIS